MKRYLLVLLVLLYAGYSWAQDQVIKSKIKLTDGSQLEVLILENVPEKYIKIQLPGNEEVIVDYNRIASIKHPTFKYYGKYSMIKGIHFDGSFSLLFGRSSQDSEARVGLAMAVIGNYRFNPFLAIGVGVEPTALFINGENLMLPVYARIKGNFRETRVSAIYMLDAGWAFVGNRQESSVMVDGGWLVRPSLGLRINKFAILVGYQLQELTTTRTSPWSGNDYLSIEKRTMKNIVFTTRLTF